MSITITKVNGKNHIVTITEEDISSIMHSIAYLVDLCQEKAGMSIHEFQNHEMHKSLMTLMKEF